MKSGRFWFACALGWTLALFVICWTPRDRVPNLEQSGGFPHQDKLIHFGMFLIFGALWSQSFGLPLYRDRVWRRILGFGVAMAVITELGQMHPAVQRSADVFDGLADVAGLIVGLIFTPWVLGVFQRTGTGVENAQNAQNAQPMRNR